MAQPGGAADFKQSMFSQSMAQLGPFEPAPHIAVAVSGGSDSLALLLLLRDWLAPLNGRLTAISVDHGLRPEAASECRQVGEIIARLNAQKNAGTIAIDHKILVWRGEKPKTGLMSAARSARYRLLAEWCKANGVLHLGVGHHADDQAETVLMRRDHGSSLFGLAGMAGLRMLDGVRLLRPLLSWRKVDLRALVQVAGIDWVEDPSNRARRFERVRRREELAQDADIMALVHAATVAGLQRDRLERTASIWLAEFGRIDPAGFVTVAAEPLLSCDTDLAEYILRQVLLCVSGGEFAPAPRLIARLLGSLRGQSEMTATLGGCLVVGRDGLLRFFRECAACAGATALRPGETVRWDRRFAVILLPSKGPVTADAAETAALPLSVAAVGERGLANRTLPAVLADMPYQSRAALPGLWQDDILLTVGSVLNRNRVAEVPSKATGEQFHKLNVSFLPEQTATSCGFTVVLPPGHTM